MKFLFGRHRQHHRILRTRDDILLARDSVFSIGSWSQIGTGGQPSLKFFDVFSSKEMRCSN